MTADHGRHDRALVAALADRSEDAMTPSERDRAEALVASCEACASLRHDLVAITAAAATAALPARPREFTLTAADAERLRPRGLRRWIRSIGSSRDAFSRPLALGLTTMGIVGLLVASAPGAMFGLGGAASGPAPEAAFSTVEDQAAPISAAPAAGASIAVGGAAAPAPSAPAASVAPAEQPLAATTAPDTAAERPAGTADPRILAGSSDGPAVDDGALAPGADTAGEGSADARNGLDAAASEPATASTSSPSALAILAGAALLAGVGLFILRWRNRRIGN
jgi:LPXTG-motif cell wall-anchored protein